MTLYSRRWAALFVLLAAAQTVDVLGRILADTTDGQSNDATSSSSPDVPSPPSPAPPSPAPPPPSPGVIVDPTLGVLSAWLANQQVPTALTNFLLGALSSSSITLTRKQAALLATLLKSNTLATAGNAFLSWSRKYNRKYGSKTECDDALGNFTAALQQLAINNADPQASAMMGLNQYTLMTYQGFSSTVLMNGGKFKAHGNRGDGNGRRLSEAAPGGGLRRQLVATTKNWVTAGKVPPVLDQGLNCGSCWAIAANAAISSALAINYAGTTPQTFSAQYHLDCCNTVNGSPDFNGEGCKYGYGDDAMAMAALYTVPLNAYYNAYTSGSTGNVGTCVTSKQRMTSRKYVMTWGSAVYKEVSPSVFGYDSVSYVTTFSESALIAAVEKQPVLFHFAVANNFKTYGSGIYADAGNQCNGLGTNHAMLMVGYDSVAKYWIAMSSWGAGWGESGFARIKMDGSVNGLCSMYLNAYAPKLSNWRTVPDTVAP